MKTIKYLIIVMAGFFVFSACQKELSAENGFALGSATGSLKSVSGQCQAIDVKGAYVTNVAMKDSNYVVVQVNFSSSGRYKISTDTSNGFSFLDSGFAIGAGPQSIKLKATGTPLAAKQTSFFVAFDTSVCSFTVPVTDSAVTPAVYTLAGSPGNCSNAQAQGNYVAGVPLISANQVSIQLNVTTPGTYSITAGPVGGIAFAASGSFAVAGLQTVLLQGSGTPTAVGNDTIPITAGGTSCQFVVKVTSASGQTAEDSAWVFTSGETTFNGTLDSVFTQTDTSGTQLILLGLNVNQDKVFNLDILLPSGSIQTGTYNTTATAAFYYFNADSASTQIYTADPTTSTVNLQVVISAYNPLTKVVSGTFTGTAISTATRAPVPITKGVFKGAVE